MKRSSFPPAKSAIVHLITLSVILVLFNACTAETDDLVFDVNTPSLIEVGIDNLNRTVNAPQYIYQFF